MQPTAFYATQQQETEAALKHIEGRYRLLSYLRLAVFAGGIGLTYLGFLQSPGLGLGAGVASLLGFLWLISQHTQVADQRDHTRRLLRILDKEQAGLKLDMSRFEPGQSPVDHAFAFDLDLFGAFSIWQLINRTGTALGSQRLRQALLAPHLDRGIIQQHQAAIRELQDAIKPNLEFQAAAQGATDTDNELTDTQGMVAWVNEPVYYMQQPIYRVLVWLLPALFVVSLAGWITTDIPALQPYLGGFKIPGRIVLVLFFTQLGIIGLNLGRSSKTQEAVGRKARLLRGYASLFQLIEQHSSESPLLKDLQQQLLSPKASETIESLSELVYRFDQRLNVLMGVILNGTMLWDIRYQLKLERWRTEHQAPLSQWFETLAQWDALNSLGRFAFNHPDYAWPTLVEGAFQLTGEALGHPLIDPAKRVDNDLNFTKPGEFLIITGANMAGKSTFLRTVGVNLVLARIGAPVCAKRFEFVPVSLMTSVRANDSLADDASYFFAELTRLKAIIDHLKAEGPTFVILDEMLRGTNSRDKQEGSRQFIEQLVAHQGIGLVATHDLALGKLADAYPEHIRNRRFEVDIHEDHLTFDYKLQPGISQNLNAVFLMKQMGIMP